MIDEVHVKEFYESDIGEECREFRQTGIAAKISNLTNVYTMYLNSLDRKREKKQELRDLLANHKAKFEN